jgi:hypothetical protein
MDEQPEQPEQPKSEAPQLAATILTGLLASGHFTMVNHVSKAGYPKELGAVRPEAVKIAVDLTFQLEAALRNRMNADDSP